MTRANYEVLPTPGDFPGGEDAVVIRDVGPWDRFMTVTNAAEDVVVELATSKRLRAGQRLFYYDSEGELDEILLTAEEPVRFRGFAPGPRS